VLAEELIVIETDETFVVAYSSDPGDWIACFKKSVTFPARVWAERMAMFYSRPVPDRSPPRDPDPPAKVASNAVDTAETI
jgi:hypothetical protein